jgi:Right handed beta helix region/RTX calcium-binding nonapeptide repeat (4 copies)
MATFNVTNLLDSGAGSLRQAILNANATTGADSITFASGLAGSIVLTSGEILISNSVTIAGLGTNTLQINGNNSDRLFNIDNGSTSTDINVTISGLTLTNGKSTGNGGAIYNNAENLTLSNVSLTNNRAVSGGAIYNDGDGSLVIQNSILTGNSSGSGGAVYFADGSLTIQNSTISGNTSNEDGGGLYLAGGVILIEDSTISGNTAAIDDGGGIYFGGSSSDTPTPDTLTIRGTTISNNTAATFGGGISAFNGGAIVIQNSIISGNNIGLPSGAGGGVYVGDGTSLLIENSTITGNSATGSGGGIYLYGETANSNATTVTIRNSTVTHNTADADKDGSGAGGGIAVGGNGGTALFITNTVVANNTDNTTAAPDIKGAVAATSSLIESPTGATITGSGNITGQDPNIVNIAVSPTDVAEGSGSLVYTFTRTGATTSALTANFTYSGTAIASTDFTPAGAATFANGVGTVAFAVGASTATVTLAALADTINSELNETAVLTLTTGAYSLGTSVIASGTILNSLNLMGTVGVDTLVGGKGDDRMLGLAGADTLLGNGGSDRLVGNLGSDRLTGGTGGDRFVYSGIGRVKAFANSLLRSIDKISDFNPIEGDRIQIDIDNNLVTPNLPKACFNAGKETAPSLLVAAQSAYADKNQKVKGAQSLRANEAVLFKFGKRTFISVNDRYVGFSATRDLLVDVTGLQLTPRETRAGTLAVANYFV